MDAEILETADEAKEKVLQVMKVMASSLDAYMQEFFSKAVAKDRLGAIVAGAQAAQAGSLISDYFKEIVESLAASNTEMKAANQGAKMAALNMTQRIREAAGGDPDEVTLSEETVNYPGGGISKLLN